MVLSFDNEHDNSCRAVLDWLNYFNRKVVIKHMSHNTEIHPLVVEINNDINVESISNIRFKEIEFYYYRRGQFKPFLNSYLDLFTESSKRTFYNEEDNVFEYLEYKLLSKFHYGSINRERSTNKLINLDTAKKCGLNIPKTLITNSKNSLNEFYKDCLKGCIIKPIRDHRPITDIENNIYMPEGTKMVTIELLNEIEVQFFPTLFQEYIKKIRDKIILFSKKNIFDGDIFTRKR